MTRWLCTVFASSVFCGVAAAGPPANYDAVIAIAARTNCEFREPGRGVYAGGSEGLGACLERLGKSQGPIAELRITSGGGDA